jgi:hypothetical protein
MSAAAACASGAGAGVAFGWIWLRIVPWSTHARFWAVAGPLIRECLSVDDTRVFMGLYGRLVRAVVAYVGRNAAATALAGLPLILTWFLVRPADGADTVAFGGAFVAAMLVFFLWSSLKRS